ncbi:hypothetical protein F5X68DRAFT_257211 [Plectosphaerella plurivora]|uniref:DUF7888 domain-containing protein n=1 Tax=Plectosphaerella plurivora TaxID=936078 RepID=A0A9P8VNT6_9PEZI|nr:hypothetical protein F5X68DRAFT_257211 [Plectosphaerella plurivora]
MQFSKITLSALLMGLASNALALPAPQADTNGSDELVSFTGKKVNGALVAQPAPETPDSQGLQKRGAILVVGAIAGTAALANVAKIAIEIGGDFIKDLGNWNEAREAFTKKTVEEMWRRNPDRRKFPATVCYNKGYRLRNGNGFDGRVSVKFELGLLSTDYDCMYIMGNNQFFTDSDGGFINLAYQYDTSRCTYDSGTGDLTCN